ncbi:MAG: group I truncated hemoglobin [Candidatus Acidiferrales bacterium]
MRTRLHGNERGIVTAVEAGLALAALALVLALPSGFGRAEEQPAKTLYERLGGYDVISNIVDDFLEQLRHDEAFNRFGGGRSKGSLERTKQLLKDQLCAYTKGPCVYIGRDMKASHEGLGITDAEWEASVLKLKASLDKFKIGEAEQKELLALVEETRKDIVEKPAEAKAAEEKTKAEN